MTVRIWLSLGSNIEREKNIRSALIALEKAFGKLVVSPVYESEAVGFDGDPFLNLVVGLEADRSAGEIAKTLRQIEHEHGRVRAGKRLNSRTLDIDLLTYGQQVIRTADVDVPREEIKRYAFVLRPLSQVAGSELHPVDGVSYQALWNTFDESQQQLKRVDLDLS